ncbi:hypothetical protein BGX28_008191 [Mortierella sp. GBA30]|nr:hypothetical protein BGX28_008191 [Mortierella sp. GBA30]
MASSWAQAPNELLDQVASTLQEHRSDLLTAALVCTAWSPVFTARLWHTLDMPPVHKPAFLVSLPRNGHHTRTLSLLGSFGIDLRNMFFSSCPQLVELDLTLALSLGRSSLSLMIKCLPRLKILRLNSCHSQAISWLIDLRKLEFLEHLDFMYCMNDDSDHNSVDIAHISTNDPTMVLTGSDVTRPDYLGPLLAARVSTLKRLSFEGSDLLGFELFSDFAPDASAITSTAVIIDVNREPRPVLALRYLNLSRLAISRTSSIVEPLLRQCPDLLHLDISGNYDDLWGMFQWSILSSHCPNLRSLDLGQLSSIDNDQLIRVVRACTGLSTLIANQSNIESRVLDAIVDCVANQPRDCHLRAPFLELDISWCSNVSKEAVQRVLEVASTLHVIKFSWCDQLDMGIFLSKWSCLGLRILEAQGLDRPSQDTILEMTWERLVFARVSGFEHLRRLVLGSSEMVVSLASGFNLLCNSGLRQLRHLHLVGTEELPMGRHEMEALASAFPNLTHFHFGLGLVDKDMQTWLAGARPLLRQEEQRIYY